MKKIVVILTSIFIIGSVLLSCNQQLPDATKDNTTQEQQESKETDTEKKDKETEKKDTEKKETETAKKDTETEKQKTDTTEQKTETEKTETETKEETPKQQKVYGVKFNFENAKAIAKLEAASGTQRAVTNADELGDLVKILADGSMENAVTVDKNCSLSNIVAIYKSPLETSKDIFVELQGTSTIGYEVIENDSTTTSPRTITPSTSKPIQIGQLICIHEDGSIADILKKEDTTDSTSTYSSYYSYMSLKSGTVTFDKNGKLYFISGNNYGMTGGDMIYQFNPENDELTKMVAAVEGTTYAKMQIDAEGQWIFVSGSRGSTYFLRVIPINNPNGFVNAYYSSNNQISADLWAYDAKNGKLYFIVNDGSKTGLFTATKNGGFKDKNFLSNFVGGGFKNNLFEMYSFYSGAYWKEEVKNSEGKFDAQKAVEKIISSIPSMYKRITIDDVDICFDKYLSDSKEIKYIENVIKGKKNTEVFEALDSEEGRGFLYSIYMDCIKTAQGQDGYEHNFLADILYVKNKYILLCNSNEVLFEYKQAGETESKKVTGADLFAKYANGNYKDSNSYCIWQLVGGTPTMRNYYKFKSDFYDSEMKLDAKKILETLYEYCNIEGNKEFRLTEFKNDKQYSSLYSTLTNEQAIEWIASDKERISLFAQHIIYSSSYFNFMNIIAKTCFIAGTNQKATTWNCNDTSSISYSANNYSNNAKLSVLDSGVYYEYYNIGNTYGTNTDPYYYIVQVADSEGKLVEIVNKLPLPSGKVVKSEKTKERILLQYSMMDENGAELGYHHIYAVEMANGKVTNCFDNVPNRNSLEVVSFNSAGDLLYYSAVRGTSVENGIVNILTNEYNPLTVQRKMVAVYTFN